MAIKILTVDDSKTIRLIVTKAFKPFDCEVLEASNGVEGLAMAARERPNLIILDITMPIMDGYETLTKLKSDPELKSIPVIMLTAEAGRETVLKIAKLGVRDYLVKPFKEDLVVERVGRVIDLRPKGQVVAKAKRFDDPLTLLVVDDKPAICDQIKTGLADTKWTIVGRAQSGEVIDFCTQTTPDCVLLSLSLPDDAGFTLFQMLRASVKTKAVPLFGLCVKTAADDQARAQQIGFNGVITKPIDFDDLKSKIARALNLDTSYKYFQNRDGMLCMTVPTTFNQAIINEIAMHLRPKVAAAVDAGIDKMVIDLGALKAADISLVKLVMDAIQLCHELALKQWIVGSDAVVSNCRNYEESKDWRFVASFEEVLASTKDGSMATSF